MLTPPNRTGWGSTADGQLNGPETTTNVIAISAGARHALALNDDGSILQWGYDWGAVPKKATNIVSISAGHTHSVALRKDGLALTWGDPFNPANRWMINTNFIAVAAGHFHNLALTAQGRVFTWGTNGWGLQSVPPGATNVIAVAAGARHSLALRRDGKVIAWGDNSSGQINVPETLSDVAAIAAGGEHSLALRFDGSVVGWGNNDSGQAAAPANLTNAIAIAAGASHSIALLTDSSIVGWGDNSSGQSAAPSWPTNTVSHSPIRLIAAGGKFNLAECHSPVADYSVDLRSEVLLIYNTNSITTNSAFIKDYYLAHRPRIEGVNVLGVNCMTNEVANEADFEKNVVGSVRMWMAQHGARHPHYILMSFDLPTFFTISFPVEPGASYMLSESIPGVKPGIFYLNMGSVEATRAYIDKLEFFGTNWPSRSLVISASEHGYGNTNFLFDGSRHGHNFGDSDYSRQFEVVSNGLAGVQASANRGLACQFCDAVETNFIPGQHIVSGTNVAGYMSWGVHSSLGIGYATNSFLKWSGHSGWWVIETVESFNGGNAGVTFQGNFTKWFSENAFGGRNYSNTPVGAIGHVREPGMYGVSDAQKYFGLWAMEKKFAVAAVASQRLGMRYYISFGDPFVRR
jgi:hypothetical protein